MIWMMILVKKGFISSNFHDHLFALPTFCGLFLIQKGAKGELSYKVKKRKLSFSLFSQCFIILKRFQTGYYKDPHRIHPWPAILHDFPVPQCLRDS